MQKTFLDRLFEAGETVTVTFSGAASQTRIQLRIDDVAGAREAQLAAGQTLQLSYTFPAGGTFDVQGRSDATPSVTVSMAFACAAAPASPTPVTPGPTPVTPMPTPNPGATPAPSAVVEIGPGIPAGFVLRTVFCDTPLYVEPNGDPVPGGAAVRVGQTWFVAPQTSEDMPTWIEGFFGGKNNAWLPANCVG